MKALQGEICPATAIFWSAVSPIKNPFISTSLVVQWLRLCVPNAGDAGSIPGQGTRSHKPQLRPSQAQPNKIFKEKKNKTSFIQQLEKARRANGFWLLCQSTQLVCAKPLQSCPALCDPLDCSLPGSSVHGIFQAGILERITMPSSRGSSRPRDQTCVSSVYLNRQAEFLPLAPPGKHSVGGGC